MAIRLFNSVGGYSVGETPANVILANGDVTLGYVVSSTFPGNSNIYLSAGNGNLYTTRLLTDNLLHANGVAWDFLQAGGTTGQLQFNNSGDLGGSANLTFDGTSNLTLTGNAILTNIVSNTSANLANVNANGTVNFTSSANVTLGPVGNVHISGGSTGYVLQTNGSGGLQWVSPGSTGIAGSNTQIQYNNQGSFGASANFTFTNTSNTLTVDNINLAATGTANLGNLVIANYHQGVLTTGAQPNITSVGTLTSLTVTANANSGNVYTGNLSLTGAVLSSWVPATSATYDLGNSTSAWRNVWVSSNIFLGTSSGYIRATGNVIKVDAFQAANNANVGSLNVVNSAQIGTDATVTGNVTVGGNLVVNGSTTYLNVQTLTTEDPLVYVGTGANGANIASYDAKDRGLVMDNYYSNNYGPINQAFIWSTGNSEFRAISDVLSVTGGVVVPNAYANIHAANFLGNVVGTTITGNLVTAAQPNITSVGTLTTLTTSGNISANYFVGNGATLGSNANVTITGGTSGQFLQTNGSGGLSWQTVSTSSISNGSSNVAVLSSANVTISSAGTSNVVVVTSTGANVAGYVNATGNVTANWVITGNSTQGSQTTTTSGIAKAIATFPVTGLNGVEYFVKGVDPAGKYTIARIQAVTDGTNVDWDVYGGIALSTGIGSAGGSFVVSISSGNIQLAVTPSSSNVTTWTTKYTTV